MTVDDLIQLGQRGMLVTLLVSGPMLLTGMVVGLIISIFQSVTQIQEITLTFVPKIIAVLLVFVLTLPFTTDILLGFVRELFGNLHELAR